jgi:hypothetical protein
MRATLSDVDRAAQRYAAFEGIAVHQYDTWMALHGHEADGHRTATLPIVSVAGDAVTQKTSSVTVPKKTPVWSQLVFQARKGGVDGLRVTVSGGVYTDPSAMAEAYASKPVYAGLSDAQAEQFQQRIIADPAVGGRLTTQIQQTCGSPTG